MPIVTFQPSGKRVEVPTGTSLFAAARQAGLPVASSCQSDFVCGKCHMKLLAGAEHLSSQTEEERRLLQKERQPPEFRISCRATVAGDCTVTTSYW